MAESIVNKALEKHEEDKEKGKEKPRGKTIDDVDEDVEEMEKAPENEELRQIVEHLDVEVKIIGAGGAGSNTIERIHEEGMKHGKLVAVNTDAQHLLHTHAQSKVLLGKKMTGGLGAGARPEVGEKAARQSMDELENEIDDPEIVFVTAGMGGGTGTGSAPILAKIASEHDALVMGIVTLPFKAEGQERMDNAKRGLSKLEEYCHTTVVIPNERLLDLVPDLPLNKAFKVADEILMEALKGMTEMVTTPTDVNIDYNDMREIMEGGELAMIGIGESNSAKKVEEAVEQALSSPLLGDIDTSESEGALLLVRGGPSMTIEEATKASEMVNDEIGHDSEIIWGADVNEDMGDKVKVLLVITNVYTESKKKADEMMSATSGKIDSVS